MTKMEFIHKIAVNLRENNLKKPMRIQRHVFHISDDYGNSEDFVVRSSQNDYIYTEEDISRMVDAMLDVVVDTLKSGDYITIRGYGTLGLKYRKARMTRDRQNPEEMIVIPGHYTPKLDIGKHLKIAAKIYDAKLKENEGEIEYRYDDLTPEIDKS